jgi:hypothetical protein
MPNAQLHLSDLAAHQLLLLLVPCYIFKASPGIQTMLMQPFEQPYVMMFYEMRGKNYAGSKTSLPNTNDNKKHFRHKTL